MGISDTWPASWEISMHVKKQQLELDMEQQTVSQSGKKYIKAVYCHPAYLTYMQSTSWEMLDWKKHKLESRLCLIGRHRSLFRLNPWLLELDSAYTLLTVPEKPVCRSRRNIRTEHGATNWFKIGKGVHQGYILPPCLFNLNAKYIMQKLG